jgi:putative FmdB family regulatory protein
MCGKERFMPIYEYLCGDCNQTFELFVPQRMSADGVVCKECHSPKVRKLVSSFASIGAASGAESDVFYSASETTGGGCCGGACGCGCSH